MDRNDWVMARVLFKNRVSSVDLQSIKQWVQRTAPGSENKFINTEAWTSPLYTLCVWDEYIWGQWQKNEAADNWAIREGQVLAQFT